VSCADAFSAPGSCKYFSRISVSEDCTTLYATPKSVMYHKDILHCTQREQRDIEVSQ